MKRYGQMNDVNAFKSWLLKNYDYSENTLQSYLFTFKDFFRRYNEITSENARNYIQLLEKENRKPKTICLRITALEKLAKYKDVKLIIKRPKIPNTLNIDNIPNENDYKILTEYLNKQNPKFSFIVKVLATTGCRVSELLKITYEDVIRGSCILKGKGSKYRRFFFHDSLKSYAFGKTGIICINRFGKTMTTRGLATVIKDYAIKAGIEKEKIHPHAFRHFFAKMFLSKTNDIITLADLLGHGKLETTRVYLRKSYDEQKREFDSAVTW